MEVVGTAGADVRIDDTGQTVVEIAMVSVVSLPIVAGQFVTVGAQEVMA